MAYIEPDMPAGDGYVADDQMEEAPVNPRQFLEGVVAAENIASELPEEQRQKIAERCIKDYDLDKATMAPWFECVQKALDLAQLVKTDKTYPFSGASNVKYPLIASAALQFNARAYPAIVAAEQVVRVKINGKDADGSKAARGDRVGLFMSHQLTNDMDEWEEGTDQLLLQLPIVGHMYRKVWFDATKGRPCSRVIEPGKMVVNDKVKSLEDAPRATEELEKYPFEIEEKIRSGWFCEFDYTTDEDEQEAQEFIEQHCLIDLDEDGAAEPYIATVHVETKTLVRLVADFLPEMVKYQTETQMQPAIVMAQDQFTGQAYPVQQMQPVEVETGVISIPRHSHFVDYRFWPSMTGGYHGVGLGVLLGDISETINSIFNMLMDAGHYASLGGGFIGSEFRLKGGAQRMRPGEWRMTQTTGGDIKSSIVPLTFPGPDATLFQMLGMLIEAGREIASVKDIMTGDTGTKNMTATTTLALIEQGMMVFTAAYKRIFRSLRKEYRILARINAQTLSPEVYNAFHDGEQPFDPAQDFGAADMDITPVADPRSVTKQQEFAKAQLIRELAQDGGLDPAAAAQRVMEAADIPDREELAPKPDPQMMQMQQETQQMQVQMMRVQLASAMADIDKKMAEIQKTRSDAMKNMAEIDAMAMDQRLQASELILKDERERIAEFFRNANQRMAGPSGNIGSAGLAGGNPQGAGGIAGPALPLGQQAGGFGI